MGIIDYDPFEVLTFDCYGTLIDWEAGIAAGLAAVTRAHGLDLPSEELLATYAGHEAELEAGPYRRYRDILAAACRGVCADLAMTRPTPRSRRSPARWGIGRRSRTRLTRSPGCSVASSWRSSRIATTTCSPRRTAGSA